MRRLAGRLREEDGATAVIMAMTMTIVLIIAALVIDVGAAVARNAQLQDAADAAAIALAQQCYESDETDELTGCDPLVRSGASVVASTIAGATLNDGDATLVGDPVFDLHTVTVRLQSAQPALFGWAAGSDGTDVGATATAEWNQGAVALPLALNDCALPEPGDDVVFVGTGLYEGVSTLVTEVTSLLNLIDVLDLVADPETDDYVSNILECGTDVLAGGWLANSQEDCTYDPNLGTFVGATLIKAIPFESCVDLIKSLEGKRVIVPVYDNATVNVLESVLGSNGVTRYAEIIVTGWDFQGLLGTGPVEYYAPGLEDPGCSGSAAEFLGLNPDTLVGGVLGALGGLFDQFLPTLLACQGLQGQLVNDNLTAEEASVLLTPYRLVA